MLAQCLHDLASIQSHVQRTQNLSVPLGTDLLQATLVNNSRELHYAAHFRDPLPIEAGDIGYITGNPPAFHCVEHAFSEVGDGVLIRDGIMEHRSTPLGRWETNEVGGVVRFVSISLTVTFEAIERSC